MATLSEKEDQALRQGNVHQPEPDIRFTIPLPPQLTHIFTCFSANFFFHLGDAVLLLFVFIFQATVINFYIIAHFKSSTKHYFWFVADLLVLVLFVWSLTVAYQKLKFSRHGGPGSCSLSPRKASVRPLFSVRLMQFFFFI
jgi:hypothetical protein